MNATLVAIRQALARELHFLARRPDLLRQQLANRLQWADAPVRDALRPQLEDLSGGPQLRPRAPFHEAEALVRTMPHGYGSVLCCAVGPDGELIASGDHGGHTFLWSVTGRSAGKLTGHTGAVQGCAISPDGGLVATAGADHVVRLWDPRNEREVATLRGHSGPVYDCAISPDASFIASASADRTLKLWDPRSHEELATLSGHADAVLGCAISPDLAFVVSASADQTLKLWDPARRRELAVLSGHSGPVYDCAISPDASFIASASADTTAKLWDRAGRCVATLRGHSDAVHGCAVTPDATEIISASSDKTLKLWDRARPAGESVSPPAHELPELPTDNPFLPAWMADHISEKHASDAIEAADGSRATLEGHALAVRACAATPDGRLIVSAGVDRTVKLWRADPEVVT